ncbi:MAG: PEGA domain-containing protein [Myxococcales bacterium]
MRAGFTMLSLAGLLWAAACGGAQHPREKPAQLRIVAEPATASVQVDEHFVGAARVLAKQPATVTPGKHRVTVEAPNYFPHDLELELPAGVTSVEIKLRPVPP